MQHICLWFYFVADETSRSQHRRIVLHSSTDVLQVISNLTGQLASLTNDVAALKKNHSKEVALLNRNLISVQNDNTKLKSLLQTVQTDNSNIQAVVQTMKGNNSKQKALIQLLLSNISNFQNVLQTVQHDVFKLQTGVSSGSTYVRWGRNACSGNGTETVYSGYAAGGLYSHTGAATDHLCLVPDPVWGHYTDAQDSKGKVYGAEYQITDSKSQTYFGVNKLYNDDTPCSVCRSPRPSVVMLPGRNTCYKGWTLEYNGYLASGDHVDASGTEYICLDSHPDVVIGGQNNDDENVLYFVEGVCGSLKCPPYVNGRELTCVVCSK